MNITPAMIMGAFTDLGGLGLLIWILLKQVKLETRLEVLNDIKKVQKGDHEDLVTLKPAVKRAHERCDKHDKRFDNLDKRGLSS